MTNTTPIDPDNTPTSLEAAVNLIVMAMAPEQRARYRDANHSWMKMGLHHGYGTELRNRWGLWHNNTSIAKWFRDKGLLHGDDRSGAILEAVDAALREVPFDLAAYTARCHAHWRRQGLDEHLNPIPGYVSPKSWTIVMDKDGRIVEEIPTP